MLVDGRLKYIKDIEVFIGWDDILKCLFFNVYVYSVWWIKLIKWMYMFYKM